MTLPGLKQAASSSAGMGWTSDASSARHRSSASRAADTALFAGAPATAAASAAWAAERRSRAAGGTRRGATAGSAGAVWPRLRMRACADSISLARRSGR